VFLENEVRSYTESEPTEQMLEMNRQDALNRVRGTLIVSENEPELKAAEGEEQPEGRAEGRKPSPQSVQQQFAYQSQIQSAQVQETVQEEERQANEAALATAAAKTAEKTTEQLKETHETVRLGIQALSVEAVVPFFTLLLDANLKVGKQFVGSKVEVPFLYHKTSKPNMYLTMAVGCVDAIVITAVIVSIVVAVALIILACFPAVLFNIFSIIYGIYAALFS
jgi:hypothetical protein